MGHSGLKEADKIRHFLKGIKDPNLEPVVNAVQAAPNQFTTFTKVSEHIQSYVTKNSQDKQTLTSTQVAAVGVGRNGGGNGGGNGGPKKFTKEADGYDPNKDYSNHAVEVRFYKRKDYGALSANNRNYLRMMQARKDKASGKGKGGSKNNDASKAAIAAIQSAQVAMQSQLCSIAAQVADKRQREVS